MDSQRRQATQTPRCLGVPSIRRRASFIQFRRDHYPVDLTHTYFEGVAAGIDQAKRGRSKEKRNDCPLVTLGLVLDVSGFPKRSRMFAGNVSEATTLQKMLADLAALPGASRRPFILKTAV